MDEFAAHTGIDWSMGGTVGVAKYGNSNQVVLFYNKAVHNVAKSRELGRPYHEDKIFVRIQEPGDRFTVVDRPVTQAEIQRYPQQWAQFQANRQQTAPGTQIELLYVDVPSVAATLRAHGVQTIEQCAELSGPSIDSIGMGAQQYANDAKRFLEAAQKGVHANQLRHELDQRDSEIRTLKQKIDMLQAQIEKHVSSNPNAPTLEQVAAMLAGMAQRPQFPPAGVPVPQQFDVQAAQIAATHPSAENQPRRKPGRPRKIV